MAQDNTSNPPSKHLQLSWFRQMARGLAQIHDRGILVVDTASRNLLLDSNLAMKFCDFTESSQLPLDTGMETAKDHTDTVQTDIGQLAAVMYEPRREQLPNTRNVWFGPIIEKHWTRGMFRNAYELLRELEFIDVDVDVESEQEQPAQNFMAYQVSGPSKLLNLITCCQGLISSTHMATVAATLGAITVYGWSWRR
ncbi:hypothetical protein BDW62DRAFT_206601 [Aspergillus aurantiobrunneus]